MTILSFDKPKQLRSTNEHNEKFSSECVPGAYVPNMSDEDKFKWKAVIKFKKPKENEFPFIEIRKTFSKNNHHSQVLIIVAINGYKAGHIDTWKNTKDINVKMSSNGSLAMTFDEINDMNEAINEARNILEGM